MGKRKSAKYIVFNGECEPIDCGECPFNGKPACGITEPNLFAKAAKSWLEKHPKKQKGNSR